MEPNPKRHHLATEDFLLLAAILLLPWAFGGVEIWAYRAAAFLLVSGASVAFWKRGAAGWGLENRESLWLLPAFLLGLWAAVQLTPLPPGAIGLVSPEADRIYRTAIPGYSGGAADPLGALEARALELVPEASANPLPPGPDVDLELAPPACLQQGWRTLSLQPTATTERLLWYVALLLGFLTVRQRVSDQHVFRIYRGALFGTAGMLALFALVQDQTWNGRIYWIRRPVTNPEAFGPYVSPTHFVGVMELFLPWFVGYAWSLFRRLGRDALRDARFATAVFLAVVCLVAAIASASKAGAALILVSLGLLGLIGSRSWRTRLVVIGLALALALGAVALRTETRLGERAESYLLRAGSGHLLEGRLAAWQATAEIVRDFPITGTGFGTYREIAPRYTRAGSSKRFNRAHNDYAEVVSDGGVITGLLVGWLLVAFGIRAARRVRRNNGTLSASRLGLALGLASLSLHALVDFNHQIPANGLLFVSLAAMLVTVPRGRARIVSRARVFALVLIPALLGIYGYRAAIGLRAGPAYARGVKLILQREYEDAPPLFEAGAVGFNRFIAQRRSGDAEVDHWEFYSKSGGPLGSKPEILEAAADYYLESLCTAPAARNPWEGLALVYQKLEWIGRERRSEEGLVAGAEAWERVGRSGRISLGMMRRAVEAAPNWYVQLDWLVRTYYLFGLDLETREATRSSARALPTYYTHSFARKPDSVAPWVADVFFETSLAAVGQTPRLAPGPHLVDLGKQARGRKEPAEAVDVLTRALEYPGDSLVRAETRFHLGLALVDLGRELEGREQLRLSAEHPAFHEAALRNLARAAERAGDYGEALSYVRELRRDQPRELDYCLQAARLARLLGDWPVALEALQWARVIEPTEAAPYLALAETYLEMGDVAMARSVLRDLEAWDPEAVPEPFRQRLSAD